MLREQKKNSFIVEEIVTVVVKKQMYKILFKMDK